MKNNNVILLLSGGIDSTTILAMLKEQNKTIHCLSFDYGQTHNVELHFAAENANLYQAFCYKIIHIDPNLFGSKTQLISGNSSNGSTETNIIVPGRNLIFISYAMAYAEVEGINEIFIGCNADDALLFPDCSSPFIQSVNNIMATIPGELKLIAPLINKTKHDIIKLAQKLSVDISKTISCYQPIGNKECGVCFSCIKKRSSQ